MKAVVRSARYDATRKFFLKKIYLIYLLSCTAALIRLII